MHSKHHAVSTTESKFTVLDFHHIEFLCADATTLQKRLAASLGLELVSLSDQSTGNTRHASYLLQSGDIRVLCSAPYPQYSSHIDDASAPAAVPATTSDDDSLLLSLSTEDAIKFVIRHGLAVRTVAISVSNVSEAFAAMTSHGARGVLTPRTFRDSRGYCQVKLISRLLTTNILFKLYYLFTVLFYF
jgi:4-hydroxyphenylpyruvate dioxygenase